MSPKYNNRLRCNQCLHDWWQRLAHLPKGCPKCHRDDWRAEKTIKRRFPRPVIVQPEDNSIRLIPLTQGQIATIDAEDFERLSKWNWHAAWNKHTKSFYARRRNEEGVVPMHSEIMRADRGIIVDHVSRVTLDNRKQNLRCVTVLVQAQNHNIQRNNTSGFRGVYATESGLRWVASKRINKQRFHLGTYSSKIAANNVVRAFEAKHGIHEMIGETA